MPKGRLLRWEDMARMEGRAQGHVLVESLLVLCVCVEAISNRSSKDSSCAHKGLVTNWLHHNRWAEAQSDSVGQHSAPLGNSCH